MIPIFETVPAEFDCAACMPGACGSRLLQRFDNLRPRQVFVLVVAEDPAPLLHRLQEERPDQFEWSPLEEGPPAWRIEVARRASSPGDARDITEALEWDHDRLDRLERTAFDGWGAGNLREAEAAFALFAYGLRRHIGFEEALIFPEFERRSGTDPASGPTPVMRREHREILALVAAIELAIASSAPPVHLLRRHLGDLLRAHNLREERVLYPLTDEILTAEQRNDLVRRIQLFNEDGRRAT